MRRGGSPRFAAFAAVCRGLPRSRCVPALAPGSNTPVHRLANGGRPPLRPTRGFQSPGAGSRRVALRRAVFRFQAWQLRVVKRCRHKLGRTGDKRARPAVGCNAIMVAHATHTPLDHPAAPRRRGVRAKRACSGIERLSGRHLHHPGWPPQPDHFLPRPDAGRLPVAGGRRDARPVRWIRVPRVSGRRRRGAGAPRRLRPRRIGRHAVGTRRRERRLRDGERTDCPRRPRVEPRPRIDCAGQLGGAAGARPVGLATPRR